MDPADWLAPVVHVQFHVCGDTVMRFQVLSFVLPCVWSPKWV